MIDAGLLRGCVHLSDLSDRILSQLASIAELRTVSSDTPLFVDMDPADTLYVVLQGEVRLCCEMGSGEKRLMDVAKEGELFAWSALVEPYHYTSTAIAQGPTQLATFDGLKLRAMCEEDQELGYQILSKMVELLSLRLKSARSQLAGT